MKETTLSQHNEGKRYFYYLLIVIALMTLWRIALHVGYNYPLYVDEAQYWCWSQNLDWGFYSKPPVIALIIAATASVCGDSEFCVRVGTLLFHPATSLLVFLFAKTLFKDEPNSHRVAFWSAVGYITMPAIGVSSLLISTDVALLFFWCVALLAYWQAIQTNQWKWWLLIAVVAGLGLMTKYTMGVFAISALLFLFFTNRAAFLLNPRVWIAIVIAFLIWLPNLIWNAQNEFITFTHTSEISGLEVEGLKWDEFFEFVGGQLGVFGLVLFPAFIAISAVLVFKQKLNDANIYLLLFSWVFIVIISVQALMGRANANWAAPAYLSALVLVVQYLLFQAGNIAFYKRVLYIALIINVLLIAIVYHAPTITKMFGKDNSKRYDVYARLKGWRELGKQFSDYANQYPNASLLASGRDKLATLAYYSSPINIASWNTENRVRHHFDIDYSVKLGMEEPSENEKNISQDNLVLTKDSEFIWVLDKDDVTKPELYFMTTKRLDDLVARTHSDYERRYKVYYVKTPIQ